MAQVRYLGMDIGEPFDSSGLRTDPGLGRFVPLKEPLPVGTEVELDGAPLRVTRVEEGTASGFWLRAAGVPRPNPDEIVTARNIEIVAESGEPEAAESEGDAPAAEPDKSDGGDKGAGGGGDRKRRRRGKTLVGR